MRRILLITIPIAVLAVSAGPAFATTQAVDETASGMTISGIGGFALAGSVTGTPIANGDYSAEFTVTGDGTPSARCSEPLLVVGDVTLTGRGGAELVKRERGTLCGTTGVFTGTWTARPNQSTGRFAGATGSGTVRMTITIGGFTSNETGTLFPIKSP